MPNLPSRVADLVGCLGCRAGRRVPETSLPVAQSVPGLPAENRLGATRCVQVQVRF